MEFENSQLLAVQVREQIVNIPLLRGERTTAGDVVSELSSLAILQDLLFNKRVRLIFSGRVLNSSDTINLIVPLGSVVQCAIQDVEQPPNEEESHQEENEAREHPPIVAVRRPISIAMSNAISAENRRYDFILGFSLGFTVGPLMCFWLLEGGSLSQKVGILFGIAFRSMIYEYRELFQHLEKNELVQSNTATIDAPIRLEPKNSFEFVPLTGTS